MSPCAAFASPVAVPGAGTSLSSNATCRRPGSVVSAQFKMPSLPSVGLPSIPGFGQGKTEAEAKKEKKPAAAAPRAPPAGAPTVRAATGAVEVPAEAKNAKTLSEITGQSVSVSLASGAGWKRFPKKRLPGANLDNWKAIAREIGPDV